MNLFISNIQLMSKVSHTITTIYVSSLIAANIAAVKIIDVFGLHLSSGIIVFPIVYIIGDVVTEVYGYKEMRKIIFSGFFANLIVTAVITFTILLPSAPFWNYQEEYKLILGQSFIILTASFMGYLCGSLLNSWTMDKMKKVTKGKHLWLRIILSNIVGEGADTLIFITVAFSSIFNQQQVIEMVFTQWILKVVYETLIIPITSLVIKKLKDIESKKLLENK